MRDLILTIVKGVPHDTRLSPVPEHEIPLGGGEEIDMKSPNNHTVEVMKSRKLGGMPQYLILGFRHLEKAPPPLLPGIDRADVTIPVDLLGTITVETEGVDGNDKRCKVRVPLLDPQMVDRVESITLHFEKKGGHT